MILDEPKTPFFSGSFSLCAVVMISIWDICTFSKSKCLAQCCVSLGHFLNVL